MQKIMIIGNLTKDPELNNCVAKFGVAVNEQYTNKQGERVKTTEFFNCVAFGKIGEVIEKYFSKGNKIYIEGKQSTNEFEGKRYTNLNVTNFEFIEKSDNDSQKTAQVSQEPDFDDSDVPFN